jgi:hypothetical protein
MTDPIVVPDDEFDLDAVAAEAAKAPLNFRWQGESWTLKHMSQIDWRVLEAAQSGDLSAIRKAFEYGMGKEQAARFELVDQDATPMVKLFSAGPSTPVSPRGNPRPRPDSSASTEQPSRPASARTTRASGSRSSGRARSPRAS